MNIWSNPDLLASQDARNMALFLEARGHAPDQQHVYTAHRAMTCLTLLVPSAGSPSLLVNRCPFTPRA